MKKGKQVQTTLQNFKWKENNIRLTKDARGQDQGCIWKDWIWTVRAMFSGWKDNDRVWAIAQTFRRAYEPDWESEYQRRLPRRIKAWGESWRMSSNYQVNNKKRKEDSMMHLKPI